MKSFTPGGATYDAYPVDIPEFNDPVDENFFDTYVQDIYERTHYSKLRDDFETGKLSELLVLPSVSKES